MTTRAQVEAIQDPNRREHFVYFAYDAHGVLLYIGCTMQPEKRWYGHLAMPAAWAPYVTRFRAQGPYNYDTARFLEHAAILEHQPPFNGQAPSSIAAKKEKEVLFSRLLNRYLAEGMTLDAAAKRTIAEVDQALPEGRLYAPLRIA